MGHPLDGAFLRLERAERHLQEATQLVREWEAATKNKIVREDSGQYRFNGFADIPAMLPVVVGDVVHNLRAALDYLIYELSLLDSDGLAKDVTQFPIENLRTNPSNSNRCFEGRRRTYLKGLNDRHVSAIEAFQPYNGVEWTQTLRDISNPDKHRHLSVLTKERRKIDVRVVENRDGEFFDNSFIDTPEGPTLRRFDLELDGDFTIAITLRTRGEIPLMPTLRQLQAEVLATLESFKREF